VSVSSFCKKGVGTQKIGASTERGN